MEILQLPNDGYIRHSLPTDLFDALLTEAFECNNQKIVTGLVRTDGNQTCDHYGMSDKNTNDLKDFIFPYIDHYRENFTYLNDIHYLSSNSPYVFGKPWYNIQTPNQYLPIHTHQGILSYTIWLKLPILSDFLFSYTDILGNIKSYKIELSPKDNGDFIIFPNRLSHQIYPFLSDDPNETRISISGNIFLQGVEDFKSGKNLYVGHPLSK